MPFYRRFGQVFYCFFVFSGQQYLFLFTFNLKFGCKNNHFFNHTPDLMCIMVADYCNPKALHDNLSKIVHIPAP
jgi:hypothetical protein